MIPLVPMSRFTLFGKSIVIRRVEIDLMVLTFGLIFGLWLISVVLVMDGRRLDLLVWFCLVFGRRRRQRLRFWMVGRLRSGGFVLPLLVWRPIMWFRRKTIWVIRVCRSCRWKWRRKFRLMVIGIVPLGRRLLSGRMIWFIMMISGGYTRLVCLVLWDIGRLGGGMTLVI